MLTGGEECEESTAEVAFCCEFVDGSSSNGGPHDFGRSKRRLGLSFLDGLTDRLLLSHVIDRVASGTNDCPCCWQRTTA